jgi:hypothetical protein
MALLAMALTCLAITPGCGGSAASEPPSVARFAIAYERTGGFAPNPQSLRIKPGRHAVAKGQKEASFVDRSVTVRFRVGVKPVERLHRALKGIDFESIRPPIPNPGCADCFEYKIRYREQQIAFSDINMPKRLTPVVRRLEALIEAHLPFH